MNLNTIYQGDCLDVLKEFSENSIDSIVTDPPYGLSFMGKKWDYDVPSQAIWEECLRVLKPGGHLLAFAGTRTQHRMAVRIEDAGFEIRDMIAWVYGSGFPKSLNIGKAVDKLQGNEREIVAVKEQSGAKFKTAQEQMDNGGFNDPDRTEFSVDKGTSEFEGWGTALKPALEPITVARKPISEKSIAENVLKWNTGGINIDESRVGTEDNLNGVCYDPDCRSKKDLSKVSSYATKPINREFIQPTGRFPANLIHDGSEEVLSGFPETNSRFFYCAKASKSERNKGCEGLEEKAKVFNGQSDKPSTDMKDVEKRFTTLPKANNHPTVKPIALMEYLINMVTPKGGIVLDPFAGSGSTLIAAEKLGFNYIGIELNPEYIEIAQKRLSVIQPRLAM